MRNKKLFKRLSVFALVIALLFGQAGIHAYQEEGIASNRDYTEAANESLIQGALEQIQTERLNRGLIGFDDDFIFGEGEDVSVIVVFEHSPAPIQVIEAEHYGDSISLSAAQRIVEDEHAAFIDELHELYGTNPRMRSLPFDIAYSYHDAINGVSITLSADYLTAVAEFSSVRAIYPVTMMQHDPIDTVALTEAIRNPEGMQPGRREMQADQLHEEGVRGAGVIVAVLDTGIDYYHPAFAGSFITIEDAQELNPSIPDSYAIYGYFFGRDFIRGRDDVAAPGESRGSNDPMETTFAHWQVSGQPEFNAQGRSFHTSHGTHVSGTILGRDSGEDMGILGVAPEAMLLSYRVLGPYGSGPVDGIVAALEYAVRDGADVINMSLGGGSNAPHGDLTTIAVTNLMLANPYLTIVVSAGNSGPDFYSVTAPGASSPAIVVSNIINPGYTALSMVDGDFRSALRLGSTPDIFFTFDETVGSYVSPRTNMADTNGRFNIISLPRTEHTLGTPGYSPGVGVAADFALLQEMYTAEELAGSVVLVRRGHLFVEVAASAVAAGLGGVIAINHNDLNDASNLPNLPLPYLFIGHTDGYVLFNRIQGGVTDSFIIDGKIFTPKELNTGSSRGPIAVNYEIKPDIGAHGTNVLSAFPPWEVLRYNTCHSIAYGFASGTSMSAPHIAGAVALLVDYSRQAGSPWTAEEMKVRLMNTGSLFPVGDYGVFEVGSGYANVLAAAKADSFVSVKFEQIPTEFGVAWEDQDLVSALTGSFSFGGTNHDTAEYAINRTMEAFITNTTTQGKTYYISYEFITGPRNVQAPTPDTALTFSATRIEVPAGSTASFTANLHVPYDAPLGFYEGYVTIVDSAGNLVANLPFAGANVTPPRDTIEDVVLYNPVISTSPNAMNFEARELGLIFTPYEGFAIQTFFVRNVEGIDVNNWWLPPFADAVVAHDRTLFFRANGVAAWGQPYSSVISEGHYRPIPDLPSFRPLPEGEYFMAIEVFRQTTPEGGWVWDFDLLLPFAVDNTPPELTIPNMVADEVNTLAIGGRGAVTLRGNVFDDWLACAAEREVTFDIWRNNSPIGPVASQSFNAVFVQADDGVPVRAYVDSNGDFEVVITEDRLYLPLDVRVTAIDNFSVIPAVDVTLGHTNVWFLPRSDIFSMDTFLNVDPVLMPYIRTGHTWGFMPNPLFELKVWSGLNYVTLDLIVEQAPVVNVIPSAVVNQIPGNHNELIITITEVFADGSIHEIVKSFMVPNNSDTTHYVGGYTVFVSVRGNTQIREIRIVE